MSDARCRRSHRRAHGLTALLVVLALAALSLLAACGGGGGGGGSTPTSPPPPPPPPPAQPSVTFTPAAPAGAGSLALAMGAASTPTHLVLEVRSGGIQDLYGVGFDLQYPSNLLQLTQVAAGPLLSGGVFQQSAMGTGNVIVGVSRLGPVAGVSDAGVIATVEFKPLVSGTGLFSFSRNTALDSTGKPLTVTWIAGSVTTVVIP
jgi:hypothetical protein